QGNVWVGDFYNGVVTRFKAGSPSLTPDKIDVGPHGVPSIIEDNEGNIWFGTVGDGLIRLKERRLRAYSVTEGMPGDSVQAITGDGAEGVWATTDRGVVHLSRALEPTFKSYTTKEGLPENYTAALHRDPDGTLWIGHSLGLT